MNPQKVESHLFCHFRENGNTWISGSSIGVRKDLCLQYIFGLKAIPKRQKPLCSLNSNIGNG